MSRYDRRYWLLAVGLAALAGYVDAIGFLKLGGLFVSFMSGNSTRLAVDLARHSDAVSSAAAIVAIFVLGAILGSLVAAAADRHRKVAVLGMVTLLLATAALCGGRQLDRWAIAAMVLAMSAENAVFQRDGEVSIGVTYMTGTLVKLGQRIAAAIVGGDRWGWVPYLLLWIGLISGAVAGAVLYPIYGMGALWAATAASAGLALLAVQFDRK